MQPKLCVPTLPHTLLLLSRRPQLREENDRRFEPVLILRPKNQAPPRREFACREYGALLQALLDRPLLVLVIYRVHCQSSMFIVSTQLALRQRRPDRVGRAGDGRRAD